MLLRQPRSFLLPTHVLVLYDLSYVFGVTCDASMSGIGSTLNQNGHCIEYFSGKLKQPQVKHLTSCAKLYVVVHTLDYW